MTTNTAQGTRCGNRKVHGDVRVYHANSAEVRACYAGQLKPVSAPPAPSSQAPRNADEARALANRYLANQERTRPAYPAREGQLAFYLDLVNELFEGEVLEAALAKAETLSAQEAKQLISDMVVMRASRRGMQAEREAAAPRPSSTRTALVAQVMGDWTEANFCITDEEGKSRFYRISTRGKRSRRPGTWKIQERVTDMLLPRADAMLATVCQAILDQGGAKAAGLRFAQRLHKCSKCGASLTDDTGNPYYALGLGPECGAK